MPSNTLRLSKRAGPRPTLGSDGAIIANSSSDNLNRAIMCSFAKAIVSDLVASIHKTNWVQTLVDIPQFRDDAHVARVAAARWFDRCDWNRQQLIV